MFSRTDIANLALNRLEVAPVDNVDTSPEYAAKVLRSMWNQSLAMALARHPWNFATGWFWNAAPLAVNPSIMYRNAVEKPTNCLRVLELERKPAFSVEGNAICTDADPPFRIRGIRMDTEPGHYSAWFVMYFSAVLAWMAGKPLNASEAIRAAAKKDMLDELSEVRSMDGQEGTPPNPWPDTWLAARESGAWEN